MRTRWKHYKNSISVISKELDKEYIKYTSDIFNNLLLYKKNMFEEKLSVKISEETLNKLFRDSIRKRKLIIDDTNQEKATLEKLLNFSLDYDSFNLLRKDFDKAN